MGWLSLPAPNIISFLLQESKQKERGRGSGEGEREGERERERERGTERVRKECVANWELIIVVVVYQNKACFTVIEYPVGIDTFHDTALVHSSVKPRNQTLHPSRSC